jgi:ATP-binding cassette subfamily E protein 1
MTRIAVVRKEDCNPVGCGNYLCIRACPVNRGGKDCIYKDENKKAAIDEKLCIGCMICVRKCPYEAIDVINLPAELKSTPIHQYGRNGFHLYNLPIPIFGKVVGIIGRNGIGKTTAIKILGGMLKPNLGDWEQKKETGYDELIAYFKGTEAQNFFESVRDKKITISYKPQQVDIIPKTTKGKVKDLLKKVDEKGEYEKIIELLDLKNIVDNDINKIYGGELQRVAIAATVLKKANLYIFDEPTSYLDIKQRIKISKFIRELANPETAVLVVEHDLIILDYMTDLIHLMYGKETAYGIVSLPKTTRTGINIYLSGYIKEENMRFRDHSIKFEERPPTKSKITAYLTSWTGLQKKFEKFSLSAEKGEVPKGKVTSILGENGIGKTTFVKILAGEIKQDKGEIKEKVKVSYKPQYLESGSDELVMNLLKIAIQKYDTGIIKPLNLKKLFTKKINELSGGELQKVAIALCLSQDADLFLLDEPSAYLDVEQRLIVSRVMKSVMDHRGKSALVVDHDLLFADYLSDNLIIFDGKPAVKGDVKGPFSMLEGMNLFLKDINLTFRRDPESKRPRANKIGSQMDQKQKKEGKLYYM